MLEFLARRLAQSIVVMLVVAVVAFGLGRYAGDPVDALVGQDTTQAQRDALRHDLGLDQPVPVQFVRWLGDAVRGDFGLSWRWRRPVIGLIAERAPATLELAFAAALLAFVTGVPLGVYAALRRECLTARVLMAASLVGVSLPTFLLGLLLILLFGVTLRWLPTFGRGDVVDLGGWTTGLLTRSGLRALILPSVTLALFQATVIMRLVRAGMLEVLHGEFIRYARARGLPRHIILAHALKNALLPVCSIAALQLGSIVAFAIVTEQVFQWPGLGLLFIQAIERVDLPLIAAYLVLVSAMFVGVNLCVDLLYGLVDPRLRADRARPSGTLG